jgi:exodeoxyribonuclease VII large subunit
MSEPSTEKIYSVFEVNAEVRALLEQNYIAIKGELAELRTSPSWALAYFVLKDQRAELPAVLPRAFVESLNVKEGDLVIVHGRLSLYERRGRYQLKVDTIEPAGLGTLQARIEALKKKLEAEGLFSTERKRTLPTYPLRVGVVSSQDGAAFQDFTKVVRARFPGVTLILADVHVQGHKAAPEIAQAFEDLARVHHVKPLDAVVVTRGGGSLEDLMAFNEETVARAIAECPVPVVSAIGHERDITIADLVADVRASTPSNAAELLVPDATEVLKHVLHLSDRANNAVQHSLTTQHERLSQLLSRPIFTETDALTRQELQRISDARMRLSVVRERFKQIPQRVRQIQQRLIEASKQIGRRQRESLVTLRAQLTALDPHGVLARGYSITTGADGSIIRASDQVATNQPLVVRLHRGRLSVTVKDTHDT